MVLNAAVGAAEAALDAVRCRWSRNVGTPGVIGVLARHKRLVATILTFFTFALARNGIAVAVVPDFVVHPDEAVKSKLRS